LAKIRAADFSGSMPHRSAVELVTTWALALVTWVDKHNTNTHRMWWLSRTVLTSA
jgi:hypothetical protein